MNRKRIAVIAMVFLFAAQAGVLRAAAAVNIESSGSISFREKDVTPPVDPENPVEPQEPPEVPGTGQTGDLTLDVVPYPDFGSYPVPTLNTTYLSRIKDGSAAAQTFIQVSDTRISRGAGWRITVRADPFINTDAPENRINGAEMTFNKGFVRGTSGGNKPESYAIALDCIEGVTQNEGVIFEADSSVDVGTWINCLYPSEPWQNPPAGSDNSFIRLFIPANSGAMAGGSYESILTWTISEVP